MTRHPYSYAGDSLLNNTDPSGLTFCGGRTGKEFQSCVQQDMQRQSHEFGGGGPNQLFIRIWDWRQCGSAPRDANKAAAEPGRSFLDTPECEGVRAAFRHADWSALMARGIGSADAQAFGDAHESDSADSQLQIDRAYHNNEVGRRIGSRGGSDLELEVAVLHAVAAAELDTRSAAGLSQSVCFFLVSKEGGLA
jgi:hypothetical protein